jgi:hypothetical protein
MLLYVVATFKSNATMKREMIMSGEDRVALLLPPDFIPTDRDVICGRERANYHHGKLQDVVIQSELSILSGAF